MDKGAWVPGIGLAKGVLAMYLLPEPGFLRLHQGVMVMPMRAESGWRAPFERSCWKSGNDGDTDAKMRT
jgi:hypothetical protein